MINKPTQKTQILSNKKKLTLNKNEVTTWILNNFIALKCLLPVLNDLVVNQVYKATKKKAAQKIRMKTAQKKPYPPP